MKSEGKIKHKLKQVKHRITQKEVRRNTSKKPCNCKHSGVVRGHASEPLFHVCLMDSDKPDEWEGMICDGSVPNTCPFFKPRKTKKEIEIEKIEIVDNSNKHVKHKSFSPDKFHLHLKIKSLYLNSLSRVTAQKEVMKVLKDELSNKIHALEISIEQ